MAFEERRGQPGDGLGSARRLVELEAWDEEAHQVLMRALWRSGRARRGAEPVRAVPGDARPGAGRCPCAGDDVCALLANFFCDGAASSERRR